MIYGHRDFFFFSFESHPETFAARKTKTSVEIHFNTLVFVLYPHVFVRHARDSPERKGVIRGECDDYTLKLVPLTQM